MTFLDWLLLVGFVAALVRLWWQHERLEEAIRSEGSARALLETTTEVLERREEFITHQRQRLQDLQQQLDERETQLLVARQPPEPPAAPEPLSAEQLQALRDNRCIHCGGSHFISCPRVKRIRFRSDGQTPFEIEYWADGEWPKDRVVWIEDIATGG